jgi:hypothetical protein
MSEVKRISVFIHGPNKKVDMVEAAHLDAAQSELAALREELSHVSDLRSLWERSSAEMDKCLTAAEQRNAGLERLMKRAVISIDKLSIFPERDNARRWEDLHAIVTDINAALNPTESGASE